WQRPGHPGRPGGAPSRPAHCRGLGGRRPHARRARRRPPSESDAGAGVDGHGSTGKMVAVAEPLIALLVDGADLRVVDSLLAAGRLPALARFRARAATVSFDTPADV